MTENLKEHFQKGFINDTFNAKYNFDVFYKIALKYDELKKLSKDDKKLFAYLQKSAEIQLFLSLSKCYEEPNKRHKTRSLKTIQKKYTNECKNISIKINVFKEIDEKSKQILSKKQLESHNLGEFFNSTLETFEKRFSSTWENIKIYRDKYIAHNELSEGYNIDKEKIRELYRI